MQRQQSSDKKPSKQALEVCLTATLSQVQNMNLHWTTSSSATTRKSGRQRFLSHSVCQQDFSLSLLFSHSQSAQWGMDKNLSNLIWHWHQTLPICSVKNLDINFFPSPFVTIRLKSMSKNKALQYVEQVKKIQAWHSCVWRKKRVQVRYGCFAVSGLNSSNQAFFSATYEQIIVCSSSNLYQP